MSQEGEPILQLPPKDIELCMLEFSEEERDVRYCVTLVVCSYSSRVSQLYDSFEKRSKIRLSKFIKERTLVKKYVVYYLRVDYWLIINLVSHAIVLVMILRLRQLCCHPNLILVSSLHLLTTHIRFITIRQRDTDDFEDPTLLMAGDGEKELSRAIKYMGKSWVNDVS